jgi:hypothetical protein
MRERPPARHYGDVRAERDFDDVVNACGTISRTRSIRSGHVAPVDARRRSSPMTRRLKSAPWPALPLVPGGTRHWFSLTISAAAHEYAGREKLRAQSNEFGNEAIKVTDGVYVAVVYSASNVMLIQGDSGSTIVETSTDPVDARACPYAAIVTRKI